MCLKVQNGKKQISHKRARHVSITAMISSGAEKKEEKKKKKKQKKN